MTAAQISSTSIVASPRQPHFLWLAALGSILLHAMLPAAVMLDLSALLDRSTPPQETVIEVVFLPPEPAPEPPPPEPVPAAPTPPPTPMVLAPPPPQLIEAPIAERSQHAPAEAPKAEPATPPPAPEVHRPRQRQPSQAGRSVPASPPIEMPKRADAPTLLDRDQPTLGRANARRGGAAERQQQSEGDYVLSLIMPQWLIDVRSPRFRDIVLGGTFMLQADGMLAPPYGKNDPWQPDRMIQNYRQLNTPQGEAVRIALESFLRAARNAQPFRLPPGTTGGYPRPIRIVFQMGDL
jgi:hypothetical protein